jgi:ABC-2 type transport system ATP-binding protein
LVELLDRPTSVDEVVAMLSAAGVGVTRSGAALSVVGLPDDELFDLTARCVAQGSMADLAGASGGIEVELVELVDRPTSIDDVVALLVAAGVGVTRSGTALSIVGLPDDDLFDLTARCVARSGARLRRLGQHRRSLDDIFSMADAGGAPT